MTKTETLDFNADVSRLLDIVANALYTNHDVFLRELISNAADACDRLRYDAIQNADLTKDNPNFRIHVYKDTKARTLTVVDNGIGMSKDELIDHLGTIAKSGTATLMEEMKSAKKEDQLQLIGQFGVGFYACYMVSSRACVISRKAGSSDIWVWESDGRSGFDIREATADEAAKLDGERGTAIVLDIKDEGCEFLIDEKIKTTVETYSDHVDVKIFLNDPTQTEKGEGQPINKASALWMRPRNEITQEQYTSFYKSLTAGFDEPLMTTHWRAEGKFEFTALLFVPTLRPWDLYDPTRKNSIRLYVNRVFISDDVDGLMYPWLRFVRGVIDSSDLPLNISRETLQYNPLIEKMRTAMTRKVLSELDKLSRDDEPGFIAFWGQFGAAIKEGLYDADQHRDEIFRICRFYSTHDNGDKFTSLDQYMGRMKPAQEEIYYLSGENIESLKNSPQIEGFKSRGLEVLFFTDTIDDFWLQNIDSYQGKKFKSVTKGDIKLDHLNGDKDSADQKDEEPSETQQTLLNRMKEILQDDVDDVRYSKRLTDSPVCLVAPEAGVDMHMERVLKIHQKYEGTSKPVLEINANHALIKKLERLTASNDEALGDATSLLLDQARIIQGEPLKDAAGFARRMSAFMEKGL